jgi:mono/diheme cytochrome c family protein
VRALAGAALLLALAAGCSQEPARSAEAERGRRVYQSQCVACHNPDPSKDGAVGPAVRGSSSALVRAKVLEGSYPSGYAPKRPTKIMQPMPQLAQDVPALAEYLH